MIITKQSADRAIGLMEVERDRLSKAVEKAEAKENAIAEAPRELLALHKRGMTTIEKIRSPGSQKEFDMLEKDLESMAKQERRLRKLIDSDLIKAMDATFAAKKKLRDFEDVISFCEWNFRHAVA